MFGVLVESHEAKTTEVRAEQDEVVVDNVCNKVKAELAGERAAQCSKYCEFYSD